MQIICPVCNNLTTWEKNLWRPFCSEKCKLIDLGAWLSEEYWIEGKKEEEENENTHREQS